jgi:3-hydroxy-9,10-secoandrosta-1,3,5(10)-triene-9,17-dione monooxygenase reductase component
VTESTTTTTIDEQTLRSIMRRFASGVAVVTTLDGDRPWGTTVNSFTSISLRPPLVLVAFDHRRRIVTALRGTGRYVVNVLGENDRALSDCFAGGPPASDQAGPGSPADRSRLCGAEWHPGIAGLPILDAAIATLECSIVEVHPAGDHDLYLGLVEAAAASNGEPLPLLYYMGRYLKIERARSQERTGKPER